jgi:hypothetical protein
MKKNMGNIDRITRVLVALLIAVLYFMNIVSGTFAIIIMVLAGIFILTSVLGFCPLYTLFRLNTCKTKES